MNSSLFSRNVRLSCSSIQMSLVSRSNLAVNLVEEGRYDEAAITAEILLDKYLFSDDYIKAWKMQKGI